MGEEEAAAAAAAAAAPGPDGEPQQAAETAEAMQARHRRELRDLQGRVTSKKRNATKKTRRGVNEECAELERRLRLDHAAQLASLHGGGGGGEDGGEKEEEEEEEEGRDDVVNGIAEKLESATLGGGAPAVPQQQQQTSIAAGGEGGGGTGGAGKKRNRQKERLARRAAEQEEAAARAEEEAAGMTDHRGAEREAMARELAGRGLVERDIAPDGHCLFAAAADQLGQLGIDLVSGEKKGGGDEEGGSSGSSAPLPPPYRRVRHRATDYMRAHADDFAPFLEEPLDPYLARMRDTAEWGGQLELAAVASAYGVDVVVVQGTGRAETIEPSQRPGAGGGEREKIHLAYYRHGYGLGEHYNSLRRGAAGAS